MIYASSHPGGEGYVTTCRHGWTYAEVHVDQSLWLACQWWIHNGPKSLLCFWSKFWDRCLTWHLWKRSSSSFDKSCMSFCHFCRKPPGSSFLARCFVLLHSGATVMTRASVRRYPFLGYLMFIEQRTACSTHVCCLIVSGFCPFFWRLTW